MDSLEALIVVTVSQFLNAVSVFVLWVGIHICFKRFSHCLVYWVWCYELLARLIDIVELLQI